MVKRSLHKRRPENVNDLAGTLMPSVELDDTERAALVALLTAEIKNTRFPLSPHSEAAGDPR